MPQTYTPISEIFLHGAVAYRFYANNFRGEVEYFGKVGKPIKDKKTGDTDILPWIFDRTNKDHLAATEIVANKLEELKNAAFQQSVNSQSVRVSSLDQQVIIADEELEPQPVAPTFDQKPEGTETSTSPSGFTVITSTTKAA